MFAARVTHPLRPGALGAERAAFDAALALWSDFLAAGRAWKASPS